jgi:hypothetical protein
MVRYKLSAIVIPLANAENVQGKILSAVNRNTQAVARQGFPLTRRVGPKKIRRNSPNLERSFRDAPMIVRSSIAACLAVVLATCLTVRAGAETPKYEPIAFDFSAPRIVRFVQNTSGAYSLPTLANADHLPLTNVVAASSAGAGLPSPAKKCRRCNRFRCPNRDRCTSYRRMCRRPLWNCAGIIIFRVPVRRIAIPTTRSGIWAWASRSPEQAGAIALIL